MASTFEDLFDMGFDVLASVQSIACTFYTAVNPTSGTSVQAIFNEQVGAIDGYRRAVFTADRDAAAFSSAEPLRGDFFVIDSDASGARWVVVDVRDDESGGYELRCDGTLERQ